MNAEFKAISELKLTLISLETQRNRLREVVAALDSRIESIKIVVEPPAAEAEKK